MNQIYCNNKEDRNLTAEVVRRIGEAGQWIKACNLFFDDPEIAGALLNALERGVAVFILTNLYGSTGEETVNKVKGKREKTRQTIQNLFHTASLTQLYEAGAHISGLDGLHAKFLLTDREQGMVTSMNFNPNSVGKISELGVGIDCQEFRELEEVFDRIFMNPDQFKFETSDRHFAYRRSPQPIDCERLSRLSGIKMTLAPTKRGESNALSKCNIYDLRDEIFTIINTTKKGGDLYIATYSFNPETVDAAGETLEDSLLKAKQRGVNIRMVMRKEKRQLVKGLFIHYHEDNHAKVVMNGERGILFTGNLTQESFQSGFDLGVALTEAQQREVRTFVDNLIEQTKI